MSTVVGAVPGTSSFAYAGKGKTSRNGNISVSHLCKSICVIFFSFSVVNGKNFEKAEFCGKLTSSAGQVK